MFAKIILAFCTYVRYFFRHFVNRHFMISAFGSLPSEEVEGVTVPPTSLVDKFCGEMRGLQGHHNSCYLDATLYAMFAFSSVFDTLLHREQKDSDLKEYGEVQLVLREAIVNPLRT